MAQESWNKNDKLKKENSINLFKEAAKRVPAYKDFLKTNKVRPDKIKSWDDFLKVPHVNKKNYLRKYPLKDLCWDGSLNKPLVFSSTSSSTGEPFYFARDERVDLQSSEVYESFLKQNVLKDGGSTLIVVCFGMGVWIGGVIAYESFSTASRNGNHPVSILTPGINKKEIFGSLCGLASNFDNVVLVGYPPFIKDIIVEAPDHGINLKKMNLKLVFAAEVFTENFRDYLVKKAGIKNPYLDILHIYGSADIGTMAWETGISTLIKKLAMKDKKLFSDLFPDSENKTPTLAQYNPKFINFEAPSGEIILTGNNAMPLIRYAIGDRGGVFTYDEITQKLAENGYDLKEELKKFSISNHLQKFPFVYVFERLDFSTTIYGLQIYPEMIRDSLLSGKSKDYVTGKFTMLTKFDKNHDQYLEINLELRKNIKLSKWLEKMLADKVVSDLCKKSSEFRELYAYLKERAVPRLVFWSFEDEGYFKPGIKQRWINREAS